MAFVVEDGTGLSNANSYASEAEFDAYWFDRNREDLADTEPEEKQAALIVATDWADLSFRYRGIRKILDATPQALEWPRTGVVDHFTRRFIDPDSVPQAIKAAVIEAAAVALTEDLIPTASATSKEIISETVGAGPLRRARTYAERLTTMPIPRKAILYLEDLLAARELWRT